MRQLFKVIGSISVLLVMQLLKVLLDKDSASWTYYFNLLSCYQLLILFWCVFSIVLEELILRRVFKRAAAWASFAIFFVLIGAAEGMCTYLLDHPEKIPLSVYPFFKRYYDDFDCRIIQYDPRFSRYNDLLFYEFRNNAAFVFSNREFSDSFFTNRVSLRDDETSLVAPDIICVGDSYTLGWGSSQTNNFPSLIERQTGLKVLNVSMSSYGTAREMMKLQTMDLSHVRYIFWQYCFNDEEENHEYVSNGFQLKHHSKKSFEYVESLHEWTRKYFPARHFLTITKLGFHELLTRNSDSIQNNSPFSDSCEQEQKAFEFLSILSNSKIDFSKTHVLVFELGPYPISNTFIRQVQELSSASDFKDRLKGNLEVLDASSILEKNDYYLLDVHLKQKGNEKLVGALIKTAGL
jgi:hypothetical protein